MIKLIYQSILQRKSKFILLIIQFTIGFIALLFGLSSIFHLFQYKQSIEQLSPLDSIHFDIENDEDLIEKDTNIVNEYRDVFKQLKEQGLVEKLGLFELIRVYDSPQITDDEFRLYVLNTDYFEMSNLTLEKGTIEPLKNYDKSLESIPVVVSAALKDNFNIGKSYQIYYVNKHLELEKKTIKVVGILATTVHFWSGGSTYISENITRNKAFILAPKFKEYEDYLTYEYNSLIQLPKHKSETEREINIEQIQLLFEKNGLNVQYNELQDEVNSYYETQKVVIVATIVFAIILLILSLLGCIGAILVNITTRYEEFGIFYSLGLTKKHMIRLVYGEIITIFGISFILAAVICKVLLAILLTDEEISMSLPVIFVAFIIMLICIILTAITPFIKLKKLEPIEMIKGAN